MIETDTSTQHKPASKAWTIIWSIFFPGFGHYYAGLSFQPALAIVITFAVLKMLMFVVIPRLLPWQVTNFVLFTLVIIALAFLIFSALKTKSKFRSDRPHRGMKQYAGFLAAAILVGALFDAVLDIPGLRAIKSFNVPTNTMEPNITVGDKLLVNLTKVSSISDFHRGEIIVFQYPKDPAIRYIKRIVGLPGDKIRIDKDGVLIINSVPQSLIESSDQKTMLQNVTDQPTMRKLYDETLDGRTHAIMRDTSTSPRPMPSTWPQNEGEYTVPANEFFVLGDNRDNSADSRLWGTVPLSLVVGHVEGVLYNYSSDDGLRKDRFLKSIR